MHLSLLLAASAAASISTVAAQKPYVGNPTPGSSALAALGLAKLAAYEVEHPNPVCSIANARKRQEWNTFTNAERLAYINAVKCLQKLPSQIGADVAPGARTRYDDFVATHIMMTLYIHGTGNFLTWHRRFTWAYEHALQTQCGYQGTQPYLNWPEIKDGNPIEAPLFDGSEYSISGNGAYVNHTGAYIPSVEVPDIYLPPDVGGGCVTSGPFKDMVVNLGPVAPALSYIPPNGSPSGLDYNPRCLRRDLSYTATREALTDYNVTTLIADYNNILDFQNTMQGDFPAGLIGTHTAGHFIVGGDPGGDLFTSPGDPFFFFHHAQVDRVYWIWQNQDLANRKHALAGDTALLNPNSPPAKLNDTLYMPALAPNITIYEGQSTTDGPYCYIYV